MLELIYAPGFLRELKKMEPGLQKEVLEKIELFKNKKHHRSLRVHKLHGALKNRYSFSVNYRTRIVFSYSSKKQAHILAIGDHNIYD